MGTRHAPSNVPQIACLGCGKRVPKRLHRTLRCQRCVDALDAVTGAFEVEQEAVLAPPTHGQPGSFLERARVQRAARLASLQNPGEQDVQRIRAWAAAPRNRYVAPSQPITTNRSTST